MNKNETRLPFSRCQKCGTSIVLKEVKNPKWSKHSKRLQPYCPNCGQMKPKLIKFFS